MELWWVCRLRKVVSVWYQYKMDWMTVKHPYVYPHPWEFNIQRSTPSGAITKYRSDKIAVLG